MSKIDDDSEIKMINDSLKITTMNDSIGVKTGFKTMSDDMMVKRNSKLVDINRRQNGTVDSSKILKLITTWDDENGAQVIRVLDGLKYDIISNPTHLWKISCLQCIDHKMFFVSDDGKRFGKILCDDKFKRWKMINIFTKKHKLNSHTIVEECWYVIDVVH